MKTSLIISLLNEQDQLPTLLTDLENQRIKPNEIVFIDGGSVDSTIKMLKSWNSSIPHKIIQLNESSISEARNHGILRSKHDWILFTDSGCRLPKEWIASFFNTVEHHQATNAIYFTPVQLANTSRFEIISGGFMVPSIQYQVEKGYPTTRSLMVHRSLFTTIGMFNTKLKVSEDYEWMNRATSLNTRFIAVNEVQVTWTAPKTMDEFVYKIARYSFYDGVVHQRPKLLRSYALRYAFFICACLISFSLASILLKIYLMISIYKVGLLRRLRLTPPELISAFATKLVIDIVVPSSYLFGFIVKKFHQNMTIAEEQ